MLLTSIPTRFRISELRDNQNHNHHSKKMLSHNIEFKNIYNSYTLYSIPNT